MPTCDMIRQCSPNVTLCAICTKLSIFVPRPTPIVDVVHSPAPSMVRIAASSNGDVKKLDAACETWWSAKSSFDDGTFSARVSGSQRERFLTRVPGQNNNDVEGKNKTFNVDAQLSYKVTANLDFTLEGVNLTNQANDQYISSTRNSAVVNNITGREYVVGIRYKF